MRIRFVCEEHREFGSNGLRAVDCHDADPLGGMAVAHDMLEHFPGEIGSVEGEFKALGAAIYVRAEPGYFAARATGNPNAADNLASDFCDILAHVAYEHYDFVRPPATRRRVRLDDDIEELIADTLRLALREARDRDDSSIVSIMVNRCDDIAEWMRIGYRAARRRYRGIPQGRLCYLFQRIEEEADRQLKWLDVGQRITITASPKSCDVSIREEGYEE